MSIESKGNYSSPSRAERKFVMESGIVGEIYNPTPEERAKSMQRLAEREGKGVAAYKRGNKPQP